MCPPPLNRPHAQAVPASPSAKGGTNPTGLRAPYLGESQVSKRTYDYQAAVGEYGQIRESYGRLRAIHLFCRTFSGFFEQTRAVLPAHLKDIRPDDPAPLRFSVRVKDGRGFLFVNNFQDHAPMRDRADETVTLSLPDGDITFRFGIAAGENAILPFNMPLGGVTLKWATAQPMANVGNMWFFLAPEGMTPRYCFAAEGVERVVEAEPGGRVEFGGVAVVTLSRRDSLGFNVIDLPGGRAALLCDKPLLWNGETLSVELEEGGAEVLAYPEDALSAPAGAAPAQKGVFRGWRVESGLAPVPAVFRQTGIGRYAVDIPAAALKGHKRVLLRMTYRGDIGHAFAGNELISDNLCNGAPWDVRVDDSAAALAGQPLTVYITPAKENVTVDASAMAGLRERAGSQTAELLSAELAAAEDFPVPCGRRQAEQGRPVE